MYSRRKFLQGLGKLLLALGLSSQLPASAYAAQKGIPIEGLTQLITSDPSSTRRLIWTSRKPLDGLRLETSTGQQVSPSMTSFTEDGETLWYGTALLSLADGSHAYRLLLGSTATDWYPLPAIPEDHFTALIFTDSQCGTSYQTWRHTLEKGFSRLPAPSFFADLGDLVDNGESSWHWQEFFRAMSGFSASQLFVPVMGNHECYGLQWTNHLPEGFLAHFPLPKNHVPGWSRYFYSFDIACAHITVVNTQAYELEELKPGMFTAEIPWLKNDLARTEKPWRIVLMHRDIRAYDETQSDGSSGGFSDTGRTFLPIFEQAGVDLVLTGHMHAYRNHGHIQGFQRSTGGPVYVMAGLAGNEQYFVPEDALDLVASPTDKVESYVTLEVRPDALTLAAWLVDGRRIDQFTLKK
jgi:hypothetical protein